MLPTLDEIPKKRKALGLTQSKLAQLAGVSQSIIAKIESGTVDPSYSIAKRLVEALEKESIQSSRPRVSEIMSKPVISVSKTQLVRDAVDLMRKRGYSQLPVFDGNRCVGSISEKTILDRAARGEPHTCLRRTREVASSLAFSSDPQRLGLIEKARLLATSRDRRKQVCGKHLGKDDSRSCRPRRTTRIST